MGSQVKWLQGEEGRLNKDWARTGRQAGVVNYFIDMEDVNT